MRAKLTDRRLYWRGSVIWARVIGPTGRIDRFTTKCRSEAAAIAAANDLERRATDPTYAAASTSSLDGMIRAYFADLDRRGRSASTKKIARQKVGHFGRIWGLNMRVVHITARLVLEYIDARKSEGVTDHTIKLELGHLRQMLAIARHVGTFHEESSRILPPFFSKKHKPRERWPTPAEMAALLPELEPSRAAHVVYILATGARREESFRARRVDADFVRGVVHVHGTKTKLADDDVPITRVNEPLLRFALSNAPGADRLFHPWGNLSRDLDAACARAKIPKLTPNDLRRGFARWHLLAGIDVQKVSKMLRHATDKLAQTTYAKATGEEMGALIAPQIRQLPDVSFLYVETTQNGTVRTGMHDGSAINQAPPREFESLTNALGKRPQTTPFEPNSREVGINDCWFVRELYADVRTKSPWIPHVGALVLARHVASEWTGGAS